MKESVLVDEFAENASWIEISQSAFSKNVSIYRNNLETHILLGAVLKGNAYGHGFLQTLEILHGYVDILFVINPIDAFKIRKYEKENELVQKRVVVLGSISPDEAVACAKKVVEVAITDENWSNYISHLKRSEKEKGNSYRPLKAHIHIDTGLSREGFVLEGLEQKISFLKENESLIHVQGVMSHFANTEDVTEQSYAFEQLSKLDKAHEIVSQFLGLSYHLEKHIAQSASTLIIAKSHYDIARVGISMYGLWSSNETKLSAKVVKSELPSLKPALTWKCKSQSVRKIPSGTYIGYGCSCRAERDLRVALLPVGYFDGYPRLLSNKGHVLVNGVRCKVLGRVMMNHIIVDVTEATSEETNEVVATLIGRDGSESVSAENIAEWAQTINYEVVTRIGSHLKRMVVD
ncbi:alanine racemase [Silvanigrella paludirubra]|uniref:Alanine racemase n=1 Tax=Silvanigrella paludirubra TaxID=2499159 RepID=A0A6N6VW91_9BACT|nr:alanine racemase [Silvanigrella paludirubra]KAB8039697.1 alanine racemase [Silvanigrella paludirubra]